MLGVLAVITLLVEIGILVYLITVAIIDFTDE